MTRAEVLPTHLNALEAQLRVALAQIDLLRHDLGSGEVTHEPDLPESCRTVPEALCARQCDDARVNVGGMGGAVARWVCRGCGEEV